MSGQLYVNELLAHRYADVMRRVGEVGSCDYMFAALCLKQNHVYVVATISFTFAHLVVAKQTCTLGYEVREMHERVILLSEAMLVGL